MTRDSDMEMSNIHGAAVSAEKGTIAVTTDEIPQIPVITRTPQVPQIPVITRTPQVPQIPVITPCSADATP